MLSVADRPTVDKHGEVPSQRTLIVKDIPAQSRLRGKDDLEHFAKRARVNLAFRRCDMPLNRRSEEDVCHGGVAERK